MVLPDDHPVPPITLRHGTELDVFPDIASAVHDMDLEDVANGRRAYDRLGRPLLAVDNGSWPVDLVVEKNATPVPHDLESWLRDALARLGAGRHGLRDPDSSSLDVLLDATLRLQLGQPSEAPGARGSGMRTYEQVARDKPKSFRVFAALALMGAGGLIAQLTGMSSLAGTFLAVAIALAVNTFIWLRQNPTLKQIERRRAREARSAAEETEPPPGTTQD